MSSGKWCCESFYTKCPSIRNKISIRTKEGMDNDETKMKLSESKLGKPGYWLGKSRDEATKRKLSTSQTERFKDPNERLKTSKATKKAMSKPDNKKKHLRGVKKAKDSGKYKDSAWNRGLTKETDMRISSVAEKNRVRLLRTPLSFWAGKSRLNISGENHYNWKGGIACEPYCDVWLDNDFKEAIKIRDGYKCLNPECNQQYSNLCIHHINYVKKDCHPYNLITLCISCNSQANYNREWHKSWYSAIILRRYILRKIQRIFK
jgi:hypothetical protein